MLAIIIFILKMKKLLQGGKWFAQGQLAKK